MQKCEWYGKEIEGISFNFPFCCIQHHKEMLDFMRSMGTRMLK